MCGGLSCIVVFLQIPFVNILSCKELLTSLSNDTVVECGFEYYQKLLCCFCTLL